jgi:hypothetical protein
MKQDDRIEVMSTTLEHTAEIATKLTPEDGISIRVLNSDRDCDDSNWNNCRTVNEVKNTMKRVEYKGMTPLGTQLFKKVVKPLILDRVKAGRLRKPICVVLITDGEVCSKSKNPRRLLT